MLSALLNSIQTSLGSRGFLIGSVFPVVIFTCTNGWLTYRASPGFRTWLGKVDGLTQQALLTSALVAAVIVASYVLSAAASAILETFEGKHWPTIWFRRLLHRVQLSRLRHLEERYWACVHELGDIQEGVKTDPKHQPPLVGWIDRLDSTRSAAATCEYPVTTMDRWRWRPPRPDVGVKEMNAVRRRREGGRPIPAKLLGDAVAKLTLVLQTNASIGSSPATKALRRDRDYLIEAIRFSRDCYQAERVRLFTLRRFQFPVDAKTGKERSNIVLAPTTMGNIGRTIRSYAQNHYGLDIDVLWTRLQNASQSSDKFYLTLQDAKVQVDFFAACTCLAWLTTAAWLIVEVGWLHSLRDFLVIGVIGPLAALGAYVLSCRAYNVFADMMRTCIDLFRFRVLTDLHLPLPPGLEEEKVAWQNLANVMGYENRRSESGARISVTYKHS